jgi:hypothetical protein
MYDLGLEAHHVGSAWVNLPPAFVYRLRRLDTGLPV